MKTRASVVCLIVILFSSIAFADLRNGLVVYYPFNGNANDESGNWHNGTTYGATLTTDRFGNTNSAYVFDGVNDYIDGGDPIDGSFDFQYGQQFSVSCWLKTSMTPRWYPMIISKEQEPRTGFVLFLENSGKMCFSIFKNGNSNQWGICGPFISDGVWHHIVAMRLNGIIRLYVDGVLKGNNSSTMEDLSGTGSLTIGRPCNNTTFDHFKGEIDDIRIYTRALSESEIQELYLEGTNKPPAISSFTATPKAGNPPLTVTFNCSASDSDGSISQYRWVFGDGENDTTTIRTTAHTYSDLGTFNAKVTVVDNDGAQTTSSSIPITVAYGPDLIGTCEEYHFYNATKTIKLKLKLTNTGNIAAGPFKVGLNLSNNGTTPVTPAFKEVAVASGLGVGQSTTLTISHTFTTSIYGKYVLVFIDPRKTVAEVDETNNGSRIVIQPMATK